MPELPNTAYFTLVPDWVCKVLSRTTEELDCDDVWLLDRRSSRQSG